MGGMEVKRMYEKIEKLMKETNQTAYQVSKATGIGQASLSDYKHRRTVPKFDKLQKLAKHFGVTVDYFAE